MSRPGLFGPVLLYQHKYFFGTCLDIICDWWHQMFLGSRETVWPTKSCCTLRIPERFAWLYQPLFTPRDVLCLQTTGCGCSLANHVNAFEDSGGSVADKPAWSEEDCCSLCLKSLFSLNHSAHSYSCPCTVNRAWTSAKQDVVLSPASSTNLCNSSTCNSYGDPNYSSSFSSSALPWVSRLVAGFSHRRPRFYPKQV
jgi:hypothetical protein